MTKTEEMMALADSLERGYFGHCANAAAALREYAATMDQEPVAWAIWAVSPEGAASFVSARTRKSNMAAFGHYDSALYAHPPAPTTQEPVAWMNVKYGTFFGAGVIAATDRNDDLIASGELIRLYANPPRAEPAPELTNEEIEAVISGMNRKLTGFQGWGWLDVARALLKAQKEKT